MFEEEACLWRDDFICFNTTRWASGSRNDGSREASWLYQLDIDGFYVSGLDGLDRYAEVTHLVIGVKLS